VNEITTSKKRIDYYINTYSPELESMEGAAFHYCCLMKEIPFVQIRGVSNYIGERDKKNWKIETALHRVCSSVQQLIDNI
jgi:futalosine hydrolase